MPSDLLTWAPPRLAQLLPLDDESLRQIITYSSGLSKEASAEHLKNLLGDSPAALEFIASFNSRRESPLTSTNTGRSGTKNNKKAKAPLHSTGPPRRPEDYGNVSGGYMKAGKGEEVDYIPATSSRARDKQGGAVPGSVSDTQLLSSEPAAVQEPRSVSPAYPSSTVSSQNKSATPSKSAASKNSPSAGSLISDMLPNVKSKPAKTPSRQTASRTASPSSKGSVTTNNIADLTSAIAALEMTTNPTLGPERRKCNCYASIHPLFAPAPNCLRCGKIICSLEGLQPCSFCGTPLLSGDEVQSMIRELRAERGQEKMRSHNEGAHHEGVPGLGPASQSLSSSPSLSPANSDLNAAKAHRDRLLHFQAQNARRTRVVDEASDFETPNVASTLWMTPAQRALALKKQQRVMREMEEKAKPEWEKKKTFMSLDIKGGKVSRVYHSAAVSPAESSPAGDGQEEGKEEEEEEQLRHADELAEHSSGRAFSRNPLLAAGGLFRPVWKAPENKQVDKTAGEEKKQRRTWRRVQDDRDDDEKWILDGGLHGFTT